MWAAIRMKFECMASAMKGSAINSAKKIANIFGMKTSVVSWICVSACSSEMTTPTTSPTSISGAETSSSVTMASRATSRTSGPLIMVVLPSLLSLPMRACFEQAPPPPDAPHARGMSASDRHPQDVLVGRDHLVAHRDERRDGGFGFGDRRNDVDHVGFAHSDRLRLRVGLGAGCGHRVHHIFEDRAEVRSVCCDFGRRRKTARICARAKTAD